jgi:hypothetical protein
MNINPGEPDPVPKKERIAFFAEKLSASFFTAALGRTGYAGTGTPAYSAISSTASLPLAIIRRADSFFPL